MQKKTSYYHSLDSLRGIAALNVLVGHGLVAIPSLSWMFIMDTSSLTHDVKFFLTHSPLHFFWSDSAAVKLFFVLSGFVLSLPYFTPEKVKPYYPAFFIKRLLRLYLPCLAILAISIAFKYFLYQPKQLENFGFWIKMMWSIELDQKALYNVLILNSSYLDFFNRALWSIGPEIKLSLILPFFIYLFKTLNKYLSIISIFLYIIIYHLLVKLEVHSFWSDFRTFYFLSFFLIGMVLCKFREEIARWIDGINVYHYTTLVAAAFVIYTFNYSMWWMPKTLLRFTDAGVDYLSAVAAILFLVISLSHRAQAFLCDKSLIFIGKISFSIYLIHMPVITVFSYLFKATIPEIIVPTAMLFCFPLAYIFYSLVEKPSMSLANYAGKYLLKVKEPRNNE